MKKVLLFTVAALLMSQSVFAWGRLGHEVVIKVAERHLTDKAKENIAKYMSYDMAKDAVWMDKHRKDEPIAFTTSWHVYNVDENHVYDPNPRIHKGDCVYALYLTDYNLKNYREMTDSAVLMNLRMVLHFVGDLHCPTHSYFVGPRCFWPCTLNGKKYKFHSVYDQMPELVYGKKTPAAKVAEQVDNLKGGAIKKIQKGTFLDWAKDCGDNNCKVYEINPFLTEELDPETVAKSKEVIDIQMRNAGYRLAYLLNLYFGK